MNNQEYFLNTSLSYQLQAARRELADFRSGGGEGVRGTPVESYGRILIHDHDKTYYRYGSDHQECMVHILHYLKGSMENEPERTWNREMHGLIQEMIHAVNLSRDGVLTQEERSAFRKI